MSILEDVLPVLSVAQKDLKKSLIALIEADAPAMLVMHVTAALGRLEHAPCLLDERCKHSSETRPEIKAAYENARQVLREQVLIPLCNTGAEATEFAQAVKALYALECHSDEDSEEEDDEDFEEEDSQSPFGFDLFSPRSSDHAETLADSVPIDVLKTAMSIVLTRLVNGQGQPA